MAILGLPKEWLQIQLGNVVPYGKAHKCILADVSDNTWVLELEDVEKESSRIVSRKTAKERPFKSAKNRFEKGNILYGKLRPYLNKVVVADSAGVCTTEIIPLDAEPFVLNRYLFHWLKTQDFLTYVNEVSYGVNMPRLGTKDGLAAPFILVPLVEQKIIADKLDTLLAQVENTKARLEHIPKILKRFRQSVLAAAVSGRLTEEWRATNCPVKIDTKKVADKLFEEGFTCGNFGRRSDRASQITNGELDLIINHIEAWPVIRVGELCACIVPNRDKPKSFSGGYHWLLTQHFKESDVHIDYNGVELGLSSQEVIDSKAKIIPEEHVVMTCVGRLGLSAIITEPCVINQQLHAFEVSYYILPEYLAYCIRANKTFYEARSTSTTISYLNKAACNSLPIPLPTVTEQTEIVRHVEQLFAYADTIEKQANNALARVNNLAQSILAKAFRGELTEQWRKDNPELISGDNSAEALLERIKAERAAIKPVKKTHKKVSS